jgi:hypothetical protein
MKMINTCIGYNKERKRGHCLKTVKLINKGVSKLRMINDSQRNIVRR